MLLSACANWWKRPAQGSKTSSRRPQRCRIASFKPWLEGLEIRTVPSTMQWTGGSGNFADTGHWVGGVVPGSGDAAVINVAGVTVTNSSDHTILGLTTSAANDAFMLSGGTLTINGNL